MAGKPILAGVPDPSGISAVTPTFSSNRTLTSTLRATWLGHASCYLEFPSGLRVLTDPVFESRCSPSQFIGPKRFTPAACQVVDLPFVDLVVISHNHYDHLSAMTTREIWEKFPEVWWFVPLGNKSWFSSMGIENCVEMDWWEEKELTLNHRKDSRSTTSAESEFGNDKDDEVIGEMTALLGCLPCQHQSGRDALDAGKSLWSSWSIESGGKKVWFGGYVVFSPLLQRAVHCELMMVLLQRDTGYRAVPKLPPGADDYSQHLNYPHCPAFEEIGSLRGPFDLGLIPIGAYAPRSLSSPLHANPFDSVNIFLDAKCDKAMAIHWGTVRLYFTLRWPLNGNIALGDRANSQFDSGLWVMNRLSSHRDCSGKR